MSIRSRIVGLFDVWLDHGRSKSAAEDGNTLTFRAIGEWYTTSGGDPGGNGLIIRPTKVQAGQFRRLGFIEGEWHNIDVDLSTYNREDSTSLYTLKQTEIWCILTLLSLFKLSNYSYSIGYVLHITICPSYRNGLAYHWKTMESV
jgi:hypothetical protein